MKFSNLATTYDEIAEASSQDQKVQLLVELLKNLKEKTLEAVAHLTVGEVVAPAHAEELRIGPATVRNVLARLAEKDPSDLQEAVKDAGGMGEVAARHAPGGSDELTARGLWQRANRAVKRDEDREQLLEHVFTHTTASGAKYFVGMVLGEMRIGAGHGLFTEALAEAFGQDAAAVQRLHALTNDIGLAAVRARRGPRSLAQTGLALFRPYQFMNARTVDDTGEAFERLGGGEGLFETKYDGARLQIHVKDGSPPEVRCYSRKLQDVTASLPDVADALQTAWQGADAIIEGEAVAYDSSLEEKQPFQQVLSRIGRKHDVEETAERIPLVLYLFDVVFAEGKGLMDEPQRERRERLAELFRSSQRVQRTEAITSGAKSEVQAFFEGAVKAGHEGVLAKAPGAPYEPGKRTHRWMKIKPTFESLDVVVVGGVWGSGRRSGLLSSLLVAVRSGEDYLTAGKVGAGFSEEALAELTDALEPKIVATEGRKAKIEPSLVIEVDFQDLQTTAAYEAGYVLRIPRFRGVRTDKSPGEADTLSRLKHLYEKRS